MNRFFLSIIIAIAVLVAGVLAVTVSTLFQSLVVFLIGIACLTAAVLKPKLDVNYTPLFWTTITCLLYLSIRAVLSPVYDLGVGDLMLILPAAGLFYLLTYYLNDSKNFWMMVFVIALLGLINALTFIPSLGELRDRLIPFAQGTEQSGMFVHRNFCSNLLMMSSLLLVSVTFWSERNLLLRMMFGVLAIGTAYTLWLTTARAGYMGFMAGMAIIVLLFFLRMFSKGGALTKGKIATIALALMMFVGVAIAAGLVLEKRQSSVVDSVQDVDRLSYFAMATDQIVEQPIVGSGSMSYSYLSYLNWGDLGVHHLEPKWVHNEFLQALADYGLIGLLLILAVLVLVVFRWNTGIASTINASFSAHNSEFAAKAAGMAMLVGFGVNMLFSFPAHSLPNLLIFVTAIAWICSQNADYQREGKRSPVLASLMAVIGVSCLFFSFKEVKALKIFSQHDIYTDQQKWAPVDHLYDEWLPALDKATEVAPTYLRWERLSGIYLSLANKEKSEIESKELLTKSLDAASKSLERHPFHAPALANKAESLLLLNRYKEADEYYAKFAKQTHYRQRFFEPYEKWAWALISWARDLERKGDIENARVTYQKAVQVYDESTYMRTEESWTTYVNLFATRSDFLLKQQLDEELDEYLAQFYEKNKSRTWLRKYPKLNQTVATIATAYGQRQYMRRKPAEAMKWFIFAKKCYDIYKTDQPILPPNLQRELNFINTRIKFFSDARVQPAP